MKPSSVTVFVVDDDPSIRRSLSRLLRSAGYAVETFQDATRFLTSGQHHHSPSCLVLDVSMPGLTGMDLQERLHNLKSALPIVFITGHGDIPMGVRAMKGGAVDFLPKPFDDVQLLEAVANAVARNVHDERDRLELASIQERHARLTPREKQVMELVVKGLMNKQVAGELGIVEKTIKVHRARVMEKMEVPSLAELVHCAERLRLLRPDS